MTDKPHLQKIDPSPLRRQVIAALEQMIVQGHLKPGDAVVEQALAEQLGVSRAPIREAIQTRAADLGFTMAMRDDGRIYNSFDAHRLIHWAGLEGEGRQVALKHALFAAYFTEGVNISDPDILVAKAESVGLDPVAAREVLSSGRYGDEDDDEADRDDPHHS